MQKGIRRALVTTGIVALAAVPRMAHTTAPAASMGTRSATSAMPADLTPNATSDLDAQAAPSDSARGRQGGPLVASTDDRSVFAVDEDTASIAIIDVQTRSTRSEVHAGAHPVAVLPLRDGRLFVVDREGDAVIELARSETGSYSIRATHAVAADPVAIAASPDESRIFVASGAAAKVTELDARDGTVRHVYDVPREPRAIAPGPAGRVFVAHLVGGVMSALDTHDGSVRVVRLPVAPQHDALDHPPSNANAAAGTPAAPERRRTIATLARAMLVSPDATKLFVAHMAEATGSDLPPEARSAGYGSIDEATLESLRPVLTVSVMDLRTGRWIRPDVGSAHAHRLGAFVSPSAMAFGSQRGELLVTSLGNASLASLEPVGSDPALHGTLTTLSHCEGASGVVAVHGATFVRCAFDHTVQVLDDLMRARQTISIGHDTLSARAALGRRIFHSASEAVSRIGFTCDTCHPDGREDANVWSSELGNRQTPSLAGHLEGTAPYQWNGHAPTLDLSLQQTFIRLSGLGMPRSDREALADYITHSLVANHVPRTPESALATRGAVVFESAGCNTCHDPGHHFTDGRIHDIHSANMGDRVPTFDTPTLEGLATSAPFFHDGRYATLEALLTDNRDRMGHTSQLGADDTRALVAYLNSL